MAKTIDNWVGEDNPKFHKRRGVKAMEKLNAQREGKEFKLIPHPTLKNTAIEVEIKNKSLN